MNRAAWTLRRRMLAVCTAGAMVALTACATAGPVTVPRLSVPESIVVTSPAFGDGQSLPDAYTCKGGGSFPPIRWRSLPSGTLSIAVLVDDPDAPGGDYVHRLVANLTPKTGELAAVQTPADALELTTSAGQPGWTPPCPPAGTGVHHYVFTVYALDRPMRIPAVAQPETALTAVTGAAVAQGRTTATVDSG